MRSLVGHIARFVVVLIAIWAVLIASASCALVPQAGRPLSISNAAIDLAGAKEMTLELTMTGDLNIGGGAASDKLAEAEFRYTESNCQATFGHQASAGRASVRLEQGSLSTTPNWRCEWDVKLNDVVTKDLTLKMGAGNMEAALGGLNVRTAVMNLGAGNATVDLSGDWKADAEITLNAAVGNLTVRLPQGVGARVEAGTGLGNVDAGGLKKDGSSYVNASYGSSAVTVKVTVKGALGNVILQQGR
jgi:hypothetical protein